MAKGKEIIDEIAFVLEMGTMDLFFDKDLYPGQVIRINETKKGFVDQQFIIKKVSHYNRPNRTTIAIAEIDDTTIDLLISVINALRKNEERFRDSSSIISNVIILEEKIKIEFTFSATRIISGSRTYNTETQMNSFSMYAGSATEQEVISDERMTLTNDGKKKLLDILTGLETGNELISAQLWGGLGTGTTPEEVTDDDLEAEIDINADGNTKQPMSSVVRITDSLIEMEFSVIDADVGSQAFTEVALFDANAAGEMYSRLVSATQFNKNPNETLRMKIQMEILEA